MGLISDIHADLRAKQALYSQYGCRHSMARIFLADGTSANLLYRLQTMLVRWRLAPLALLPYWLNKWINGCVVGIHAQFGPGLVFVHPIGVVINSAVRGGQNIFIESGVVIGDNNGVTPQLGDDIFIGSGAKIIGAVKVGSASRVGANAVVLHDVASHTTVVGVPARPTTMQGQSKND